jgi:hypothetical protein
MTEKKVTSAASKKNPVPKTPPVELPNGMVVSVASTLTLEEELAAIDTWYHELLKEARVEYKARRKAAFEKHQK